MAVRSPLMPWPDYSLAASFTERWPRPEPAEDPAERPVVAQAKDLGMIFKDEPALAFGLSRPPGYPCPRSLDGKNACSALIVTIGDMMHEEPLAARPCLSKAWREKHGRTWDMLIDALSRVPVVVSCPWPGCVHTFVGHSLDTLPAPTFDDDGRLLPLSSHALYKYFANEHGRDWVHGLPSGSRFFAQEHVWRHLSLSASRPIAPQARMATVVAAWDFFAQRIRDGDLAWRIEPATATKMSRRALARDTLSVCAPLLGLGADYGCSPWGAVPPRLHTLTSLHSVVLRRCEAATALYHAIFATAYAGLDTLFGVPATRLSTRDALLLPTATAKRTQQDLFPLCLEAAADVVVQRLLPAPLVQRLALCMATSGDEAASIDQDLPLASAVHAALEQRFGREPGFILRTRQNGWDVRTTSLIKLGDRSSIAWYRLRWLDEPADRHAAPHVRYITRQDLERAAECMERASS